MELKLNIYNKKQIEKTYEAETYDLMFGTVEDLIEIIDLDKIRNGTESEIIKAASNVVLKGMDIIKPLLKDIFEGLTDEELRKTKTKELALVLVKVMKFAIAEISKGATSKN